MSKATTKASKTPHTGKTKLPRCRTCGKSIRVPRGWSIGPAVRRHYWTKHRDLMTGGKKR